MTDTQKAEYSKPASQLDLEARQTEGYTPPSVVKQGVDPELSSNGYIGVDPIYQNAANSTELPVRVTEGAEAQLFEAALAEGAEYLEVDNDGDEEEEEEGSGVNPPPSDPLTF